MMGLTFLILYTDLGTLAMCYKKKEIAVCSRGKADEASLGVHEGRCVHDLTAFRRRIKEPRDCRAFIRVARALHGNPLDRQASS